MTPKERTEYLYIHGEALKEDIMQKFDNDKVRGSDQIEQAMLYFEIDRIKRQVDERTP